MKTLRHILNEGTPQTGHEVVHHVSPYDIDKFHELSHFGTYKAAREVGSNLHSAGDKDEGYDDRPEYRNRFHYKARLINKKNVYHFDRDFTEHNPETIINNLHKDGIFSEEERDHHFKELEEIHKKTGGAPWNPHLEAKQYGAKAIRDKGIDMISYTNKYENPGKKSYIITHPNQVKVLKKTPITVRSSVAKKDKTREPAKRRPKPLNDIILHGQD